MVNIVVDILYLLIQEVSGPDHLVQDIAHSDKLVISCTLGDLFLFSVLFIDPYCSHTHEITSVAPRILVKLKCCINITLYIAILVY